MMKRYYSKFRNLMIATLALSAFAAWGQHPSISLSSGLATVAGETTGFVQDLSEYGVNYRFQYVHPIGNERFNLVGEVSYAYIQHKHAMGSGHYAAKSEQSFWGLGFRYYLFDNISRFNIYQGMILPYMELKGGRLSAVLSDLETDSESLELPDEPHTIITARGTGGIAFGLSRRWMVDIYASFTIDPGDLSDGIKGNTTHPDILVSGGIGLQYQIGYLFTKKRF